MFREKEKQWRAVCAEVAKLLKEERERQGMSKVLASERTGLSRAMIGYVESQVRMPTLQTLLRMADALEISLADTIREAERRVK